MRHVNAAPWATARVRKRLHIGPYRNVMPRAVPPFPARSPVLAASEAGILRSYRRLQQDHRSARDAAARQVQRARPAFADRARGRSYARDGAQARRCRGSQSRRVAPV